MPMPQQYQRAGEAFDASLRNARDELGHATRNQTYTTVEGVLLAFRRRVTVEAGLRFAAALPAVLRAMFVAGWNTNGSPVPDRLTGAGTAVECGTSLLLLGAGLRRSTARTTEPSAFRTSSRPMPWVA